MDLLCAFFLFGRRMQSDEQSSNTRPMATSPIESEKGGYGSVKFRFRLAGSEPVKTFAVSGEPERSLREELRKAAQRSDESAKTNSVYRANDLWGASHYAQGELIRASRNATRKTLLSPMAAGPLDRDRNGWLHRAR